MGWWREGAKLNSNKNYIFNKQPMCFLLWMLHDSNFNKAKFKRAKGITGKKGRVVKEHL